MPRKQNFSSQKNLAQALLEEGLISESQYDAVVENHRTSGKRLSDILVDNNYITEGVKLSFLKKLLNMKAVRLSGLKIPHDVLEIIPREIAEKYNTVPLKLEHNVLTVAMDDPSDPLIIDNLKLVTNYEIKPVLASSKDIRSALEQYEHLDKDEKEEISVSLPKKILHNFLVIVLMAIPFIFYLYQIFIVLEGNPEAQKIWLEPTNQITFYLSWALWVSIVYEIDSIFFR